MRLGATLCGAAVIACLLAITTRSWWTYNEKDTEISVGLWSSELAVGEYSTRYLSPGATPSHRTLATDELLGGLVSHRERFIIDSGWYAEPHGKHEYVVALGRLTGALGLATLLSAAALGGFALRHRKPAALAMLTGSCAAAFAISALVLVLAAPAGLSQMPMNLGVSLAFGGAGCALLAAVARDDAYVAVADPRAMIFTLAGIAALFVTLETQLWWSEGNDREDSYTATYGLRSHLECEKTDEGKTCLERSSRMPAEVLFPDAARANHRAAEIAFLTGHLLLFAAVIATVLRALGRRLPGDARIIVALCIGFAIPALRAVTTKPGSGTSLSIGPLFALTAICLLIATVVIDKSRRRRKRALHSQP